MDAYRWAKSWRGELSAPELAVLLTIADRFNDSEGRAWPSYRTIADDTRLSRRTVIRSMAALSSVGLVEVSHRRDKAGDATSNNYRLPLYRDDSAPVDNPKHPP
ncbi:hypothetical protein BHD05_15135 [Marisediminicola antarctica]|uniref:Helix-turn-helix domain-containing protein n=2 Tax=Marisediminicola antarctica TaxID=674079 RepID=A0A7L5AJK4_9MICO|nr:hypothetical protein BHD05_15135 [Marisediminicola antarctica]